MKASALFIGKVAGWSFRMLSIVLLTWFPISALEGQPFSHQLSTMVTVMLLAYALTFLFLAFAGCRVRCIGSGALGALSGVALVIGAAICLLGHRALLSALGFGILGVGEALLFSLWQRLLSAGPIKESGLQLTLGTIIGMLGFLGIAFLAPQANRLLVATTSQAASLAIAFLVFRFTTLECEPLSDRAARKSVIRQLYQPILCVSFFGFAWELVTSFGGAEAGAGVAVEVAGAVAQMVGACVFVPLWLKFTDKFELGGVYQVAFPIVATGFLLMPFLGPTYQQWIIAGACFAFGIVSILMQLTCIQVYQRTQVDPVVLIGFFAGSVYLFVGAGFFLGRFAFGSEDVGLSQLLMIAFLVVYVMALGLFAMRFRRDGAPRSEESGEALPTSSGSFQLDEVGKRYGLTQRELQVLELMCIGRDLPYISEALFISKNTVRSHSKSIYRKLNVHSKQELIDLVLNVND